MAAAQEHDLARRLRHDLTVSEDNARVSQQQVEAAVTLQRSMLAPLPELGDLAVASRYLPALAVAEVGGDWYDAFVRPDGSTGLVIGDVAGHGIDAAVQMGQLRSLLRALAVDRDEPPGDLLDRLDRTAAHLRASTTATCIYAVLDRPAAGTRRVRFANAGHPPPLLITPDGAARYLDTVDHLMLGVVPGTHPL